MSLKMKTTSKSGGSQQNGEVQQDRSQWHRSAGCSNSSPDRTGNPWKPQNTRNKCAVLSPLCFDWLPFLETSHVIIVFLSGGITNQREVNTKHMAWKHMFPEEMPSHCHSNYVSHVDHTNWRIVRNLLNDIGPVAVQFLPKHRRLVETSKHMAPNVRSGKISHVLCGGETNHNQWHGVVCFYSTCDQWRKNQLEKYQYKTHGSVCFSWRGEGHRLCEMLGETSGKHKTHLCAVTQTYVSHVDRTDCRIVLNHPNADGPRSVA